MLLGDCYFAQSRLEQALQQYRSIPEDYPVLGHLAAIQSAHAYLEKSQPNDAIAVLRKQIGVPSEPSEFVEPQLLSADIYQSIGNEEAVTKALETSIETHGDTLSADGIIDAMQQIVGYRDSDYAALYDEGLESKSFRLAARFGLLKAFELHDSGLEFQAKEWYLKLANEIAIEDLPPECLGPIGLELIKLDFDRGTELHDHLIEKFPSNQCIQYAFYGYAIQEAEAGRNETALGWLDRIDLNLIDSQVYIESMLLEGSIRTKLGDYPAALEILSSLLSYRWASSAQKAQGLLSLATLSDRKGDKKQAIAYCQRVFTLYPGSTHEAAESYLKSALYLTEIDEIEKAKETIEEFLGRSEYRHTDFYKQALDFQ